MSFIMSFPNGKMSGSYWPNARAATARGARIFTMYFYAVHLGRNSRIFLGKFSRLGRHEQGQKGRDPL